MQHRLAGPECPACGYNCAGAASSVCPECGRDTVAESRCRGRVKPVLPIYTWLIAAWLLWLLQVPLWLEAPYSLAWLYERWPRSIPAPIGPFRPLVIASMSMALPIILIVIFTQRDRIARLPIDAYSRLRVLALGPFLLLWVMVAVRHSPLLLWLCVLTVLMATRHRIYRPHASSR